MFLIISSISLVLFILIQWYSNSRKSKNSPPSPPKLPIIGNLHQLGKFPHRTFLSLAKKYGPVMQIHLGSVPCLLISSSEAAREVMRTHDHHFADRPQKNNYKILIYDCKDVSTAPYGDYWRQLRSISVLHLLSAKRVQSLRSVRAEEIGLMMEKIKHCSSTSEPVNLSQLIASTVNDIVCRVALGRKYSGEEGKGFKKLFREFTNLLGMFIVGDYVPWLDWVTHVSGTYGRARRVAKRFDDLLEDVVEDHIKSYKEANDDQGEENHKDFVDVLLWIQRTEALGFPIDRIVIKALLLDMFIGGTGTTASLLDWEMSELIKNPHMMKKLKEEVKTAANGKTQIAEEDLVNMKYLKAVVKETLRLHPPSPLLIPRVSKEETEFNGYHIKAGTQVIVNIWAIARDPANWDEPEAFKPERFLDNTIDVKGNDFTLIPFGSGRRGCPGVVYALAVNEIILANLVHQFDWEIPGGYETLDMAQSTGFLAHKNTPIIALATPTSK
ncbi:cytochrome P450 736A117-like [Vicia villosa]|uniref:cytochrome P450 736A117-like n=1 Tax=Vicia villosa TaxID=3911 RepID=UPI00273BA673|nr:cytochrome P450 736A117-like [Vicia villosa]